MPLPTKPCKIEGCGKNRHGSFKRCFSHIRSRAKALKAEREKRNKEKKAARMERAKAEKEARKERKLARKLASKTYQEGARKTLHKKCWKLMSEWVRRKDADWKGETECFSCSVRSPWSELHAGHFYHRRLDFDPRNIRPQCSLCNVFYNGRRAEYALRLVREHGMDWVDQLKRDADQHPGYRLEDLRTIHADLSKKLETLT